MQNKDGLNEGVRGQTYIAALFWALKCWTPFLCSLSDRSRRFRSHLLWWEGLLRKSKRGGGGVSDGEGGY